MATRKFPMIPAGNGPIWFAVVTLVAMSGGSVWAGYEVYREGNMIMLPIIVLPLMIVPALMFYIAHASRHLSFEISREDLTVVGFKGRKIPLSMLALDEAKVLDLSRDTDYQVRGKVQGSKMPGFKTGWCKLRNKEKALIYITDESRILYIPTREDYALLLSVSQPKKMLEVIQGVA